MSTRSTHPPVRSSQALYGFTLIELLVVVTIIVVLLALLAPALDRAIASAESAVCMANLRNWSLAMRSYASENKGQTPPSTNTPRDWWFARLSSYMGEPNFPTRKAPLGWMKANICPTARKDLNTGMLAPSGTQGIVPVTPAYDPGGTVYWGSANKVWQYGDPNGEGTIGAYGINPWLTPFYSKTNPVNYWGRYLNAPDEAPLVGDSIWMAGWPDHTDFPPADTENGNASNDRTAGGQGYTVGGMMGRWIINRHNLGRMAINMSFVDGTARNVRLGELWNLQWHKNFKRSDAYEENQYP